MELPWERISKENTTISSKATSHNTSTLKHLMSIETCVVEKHATPFLG
jgi:hypothetical protein